MLTEADLARRKPVWNAFSEFWLDTELDEADLQRIARVAVASAYTVAELRDIYLYELAPVVGPNLLNMAGEWAGFNESWLRTEARKRAEHRSLWWRFQVWTRLGCRPMIYATERHWQRIVSLLD